MKNKKLLYFIIGIFVSLILVPLLINLVFKFNNPFFLLQSEWDANSALLFYASVLSGSITFLGVYITIRYTEKKYQTDIRNKVKPYLILGTVFKDIHYNIFSPTQDSEISKNKMVPENSYIEYIPKIIYFVLEEDKIVSKIKLDNREEQVIKQKGIVEEEDSQGASFIIQNSYLHIPYQVKNIGIGPAVKLRIGCNIENKEKEYVKYDFSLDKSETIKLHILTIGENIPYNFSLDLYFNDIYDNEYSLTTNFEYLKDSNKVKITNNEQKLEKTT